MRLRARRPMQPRRGPRHARLRELCAVGRRAGTAARRPGAHAQHSQRPRARTRAVRAGRAALRLAFAGAECLSAPDATCKVWAGLYRLPKLSSRAAGSGPVGRTLGVLATVGARQAGRTPAPRHLPVQVPPAPWSAWNELAGGEVGWVGREEGSWMTLWEAPKSSRSCCEWLEALRTPGLTRRGWSGEFRGRWRRSQGSARGTCWAPLWRPVRPVPAARPASPSTSGFV